MSKTKLVRLDNETIKKLKSIMEERYKRGLAKLNTRELSPAEATRLMLKTPSWNGVENELRTMPKRRKNEK